MSVKRKAPSSESKKKPDETISGKNQFLEEPVHSEDNIKRVRFDVLNGVVNEIERSYGKGSIQKLGQSSSINVETFSSGSVTLDMAMGGGYPRGRVIEIYGPESSGKTTLALHAVAEMQKKGGEYVFLATNASQLSELLVLGTAAFIDVEHALDPVYAKNLGVNVDDLLLCQVR